MKTTPINYEIVKQKIEDTKLPILGNGTIRELVKLVNEIEAATGEKFIRMEMGVPGLTPPKVAIDAEIAALKAGVAARYPSIHGIPELKHEISRFVKLFLDLDINEECCIPTVGSMQGSFAVYLVANRSNKDKVGTLFLDPGFPVQKQQCNVLGQEYQSFDVYDYRGDKLHDKLESYLKKGDVSTLIYSNPNNPSWICFTEKELKIIGELATKYDVVVVEDLAYFGMDFRVDYSQPGQAPYQPTVAKYTENYVLLISSSKSFSYAGQRVGMMAISNTLFNRRYPDLKRYYSSDGFGYSMILGALYSLSSGVSHAAQFGLTAVLKASNNGEYNFVEEVKEYGRRAKVMKQLFLNNGFQIVYDKDEDAPIADGFYFTFSYPGFTGVELLEKLVYYGISVISLAITGSTRLEGLRACVSQVSPEQFSVLEYRLAKFNEHYGS